MNGRYKISMPPLLDSGTPRAWEPEKRTAQRWHLFTETCRSLAADGLDYAVTFALAGNDPHVLITASGSRLLFTRGYAVFNAAQVDGYTPKAEPAVSMPERIERAETWFQSIGATVCNGGNRAYYAPGTDHIQMPPFGAFAENVSYYSTLAHEHTHWTARAERCDRQLGKRFGDSAYAAEELIAELGAAFVCAHLGLSTEPREDHAEYIQSWLKVLRTDKRAIFTAASKAQQAADYLIQRAGVSARVQGVAA